MIGKRFGRLTVIAESPIRKNKAVCWVCKCDCGNITQPIKSSTLRNGESKSCGCLQVEITAKRSTKHGLRKTRIYSIWSNMKHRCYSPNATGFKNYGGRGITVCEEWKNSFQVFYDWSMSNGYEEHLTIDRIDVNGNYKPSNCRWVSMEIQQNNRKNNILIEENGCLKTIKQLAKEKGINRSTVWRRYQKRKSISSKQPQTQRGD